MSFTAGPLPTATEDLIHWALWNFLLALVPVALGILVGWLGRVLQRGGPRFLWLALLPALALWFLFLPNTCYLFTTPRHFLTWIDANNAWINWRTNPQAVPALIRSAEVCAFNLTAGALTLVLSVRPVRELVKPGLAGVLLVPVFFLVLAVGTYLGLVDRLNSWDAFVHPWHIVQALAALADKPRRLGAVAAAGGALWLLYEVLSMALDGFALRWYRWTEPKPAEPPV